MKQCPQCSAEYDDRTSFCTKDGRSLVAKVAARARLCPHCANSIAEDSFQCPYCKANVQSVSPPQWPDREDGEDRDDGEEELSLDNQWPEPEETALEDRLGKKKSRSSTTSKAVLGAGVVLCGIGLFLIAGRFITREQQSESPAMLEAKLKELQEKEQKIQLLQAQLAEVRQQKSESPDQLATVKEKLEKNQKELSMSSKELAGLKAKLENSQKELSTTQQRLNVASREIDESSRQRAALKTKLDENQRELATMQRRLNIATREANRVTATQPQPSPASPQPPVEPAPARRAAEPGTYETIRVTTVHEDPAASSRVIAQVGKGTKLTVVKSVGNWLEVRSRHGKPPGYIRWDDAMYVSSTN